MRERGSGFRAGRAALTAGVATVIGVSFALFGPARGAGADDPPLVGESFETTTTSLPSGWTFAEFTPGVSKARVMAADPGDGAGDGTHFLRIDSPTDNVARVELPVTVAANSLYHFHAQLRCPGAKSGADAAVLGVDGQTGTSPSVTTSNWTPTDLYVRTGAQTSVTFTLSLGNYGQLNQGRADFDGVTVNRVDAAPGGAATIALPGASATTSSGATAARGETMRLPLPNHLVYPLAGLLVVLVAGAGIYLARSPEESVPRP